MFTLPMTHACVACSQLDLSLNAWVDDETVSLLAASLPRLTRLCLEKTDVTDVGLAALGTIGGSLTYLDLSRTVVRGSEESYAALRHMDGLQQLLLAYWCVPRLPFTDTDAHAGVCVVCSQRGRSAAGTQLAAEAREAQALSCARV